MTLAAEIRAITYPGVLAFIHIRQLYESLRSESQASSKSFGPSLKQVSSFSVVGKSSRVTRLCQVESSHKVVKSGQVKSQGCQVESQVISQV